MNVHFLLLSCSALRANKACLLMDLHITSHFHPAAMAPASVNPTSLCQPLHCKVCFLSGFLEHLPSAKHSKNLFQSPWAGRDSGNHEVPASAESWCSSRTSSVQAWNVPSPQNLHSNASSSPSPPFWSSMSTSKHSTTHPIVVCGWVEGKGRERHSPLSSQHWQSFPSHLGIPLHVTHVEPYCPWQLSLCQVWLSVDCRFRSCQDRAGKQIVWCFRELPAAPGSGHLTASAEVPPQRD